MSIGPLRTTALLVSILAGVAAGVAAADLSDPRDRSDPSGPDAQPASDPLGLNAEMVNQDCTGEALLIVGHGGPRGGLAAALVQFPEARYLKTTHSCRTRWARAERPDPEYVVYLGPMTSREACEQRMTPEHRGHYVTALHAGNEITVKCPCELPVADRPTLRPDMEPDDLETMWTTQLQGMLYDQGLLAEDQLTSKYDAATVAVVKQFQETRRREADGTVDADTWDLIQRRVCNKAEY
jgi:hypothetical protein